MLNQYNLGIISIHKHFEDLNLLRRKNLEHVTVDSLFSKKHPAFHFWRFSFVLLLLTKTTHFSVSEAYTEFVRHFFFQLHQVPHVKPGRFSSCELLRGAFRLAFHADLLGLEGEVSSRRNICTSYQLRLVVYPIVYMVLYISGGDRRISEPSTVSKCMFAWTLQPGVPILGKGEG